MRSCVFNDHSHKKYFSVRNIDTVLSGEDSLSCKCVLILRSARLPFPAQIERDTWNLVERVGGVLEGKKGRRVDEGVWSGESGGVRVW